MITLKDAMAIYLRKCGKGYSTEEECLQKMKLGFYASSGKPWIVDPCGLEKEGHISVPESEWKNYDSTPFSKNYDNTPFAVFYEGDIVEGIVYVNVHIKYIFRIKI